MKSELRRRLMRKRDALDLDEVEKKSDIIFENLLKTDCLKDSAKIGLYYPKGNEVSTKKALISLLKSGKRVFLPRVNGENLEFCEIKGLDDLKKMSFGIMEPLKDIPASDPLCLDIIIVPSVAVDKDGNRIGRGGGFYDKFLASNPGIKTICPVYDFQIVKEIEASPHDQKINIVASEKKTFVASSAQDRTQGPKIMDGKKASEEIIASLKGIMEKKRIKAKLAVVLVGSNPSSEIYVRNKSKKCEEVGIGFEMVRFDESAKEKELLDKIHLLNKDRSVTGIIIQIPLPKKIDTDKVLDAVLPEKDVDGLTKNNLKRLEQGDEEMPCCTPKGIIRLMEYYHITLEGKKIVLVGHGKLVGKPLSFMLKNRNLSFKVCDKYTKNIKRYTQEADVLISATGIPHLITEKHIKKGCVLIDAGVSKLNDKLVGDVNFEDVKGKAAWISPVPGGVGPMTVAMLIENIINAARMQNGSNE